MEENEFQKFFKNKFTKEEVVDTNCYEDLANTFLTELAYDDIFVQEEAAKLVRVFGRWLDERK
jgi:hypothetical protein